jgi:pilus assembly protein Flp/PilA
MNSIQQAAIRFKNDTKAVTALEYGMIAALIAVVLLTGFATLGNKLSTTLSTISAAFPAG